GTYLENDVSIPQYATSRKKAMPRKREREEAPEKKAPSLQTTQSVDAPESCAKPSTYAHRKKSPIKEKEKTPEEEVLEEEVSPRNESPTREEEEEVSLVKKKQKTSDK
ncbi:hypothetical protein KI387_035391, partial [Taxus chinensis]